MNRPIQIVQFYPDQMDNLGNLLVLQRRLEWRGIPYKIHEHKLGDQKLPEQIDLMLFGGGADSMQKKLIEDLQKHRNTLKTLVENGTPTLLICASLQMFGRFFEDENGEKIDGLGILDLETKNDPQRLTGNIIVDSQEFGRLVGFENHRGRTFLDHPSQALGEVIKGAGNNNIDCSEGIRFKNLVGSYLHGPLLAKAPRLADWLLEQAGKRYNSEFSLSPLAKIDQLTNQARWQAENRPR